MTDKIELKNNRIQTSVKLYFLLPLLCKNIVFTWNPAASPSSFSYDYHSFFLLIGWALRGKGFRQSIISSWDGLPHSRRNLWNFVEETFGVLRETTSEPFGSQREFKTFCVACFLCFVLLSLFYLLGFLSHAAKKFSLSFD